MKLGNEEISLNGYIISKHEIRLSRKRLLDIIHILKFSRENHELARINVEQFLLEANKLELYYRNLKTHQYKTLFQFVQYLCGYRAYLISFINNDYETRFQKELIKIINKIEQNVMYYL